MPEFKDTAGRIWQVKLNIGMIEDIQEETDIDLDQVMQEKSKISELIFATPRKLVEILYVICQEQIKQIPLTAREFGRAFDREVLDKAADAFLQSLLLFYPRTSAGKVLAEEFPQLILKMDRQIESETRRKMKEVFSDTPIG